MGVSFLKNILVNMWKQTVMRFAIIHLFQKKSNSSRKIECKPFFSEAFFHIGGN